MPITIKGIRVQEVSIKTAPQEDGTSGITSSYALLSSEDKILATQDVGGYNGMKLTPCPDTMAALNNFIKLYKRDLNSMLGLEES